MIEVLGLAQAIMAIKLHFNLHNTHSEQISNKPTEGRPKDIEDMNTVSQRYELNLEPWSQETGYKYTHPHKQCLLRKCGLFYKSWTKIMYINMEILKTQYWFNTHPPRKQKHTPKNQNQLAEYVQHDSITAFCALWLPLSSGKEEDKGDPLVIYNFLLILKNTHMK